MKQPKISNLMLDKTGTKALRNKMAATKKIKITINIDEDVLGLVRELAEKTGVPYQKLLNRTLREHLASKATEESRLDALEREVNALKRKVSGRKLAV